jgi:hypothetical protein
MQGRSKKRKVDYDRMSAVNKERVKEAVLASMGIKTTANKFPDKSSSDSPSTSDFHHQCSGAIHAKPIPHHPTSANCVQFSPLLLAARGHT